MDVDVDFGRVYLDKQNIQRISICGKNILVGIHHRMVEVRIFDKTLIDKEKLFATGLLCKFRLTDKSTDRNNGGVFLYRHKTLVIVVPEKLSYRLFKVLVCKLK